jgi:hypothetical protein
LDGSHPERRLGARNNKRRLNRGRRGPSRPPPVPLTQEGVPAATPDAQPVSAVVLVSDESRERYPWLPGRVIAGSVWRGPGHDRVQVDDRGDARPWKKVQRAG